MAGKSREEDAIQRSFIKWIRLQYPTVLAIHVPNGGWRKKSEAAIMVGLGVTAGFPDVFVFKPNKYYCGLAIEIKTPKGKVSPRQMVVMSMLNDAGYKAVVCRSVEECINITKEYLDKS